MRSIFNFCDRHVTLISNILKHTRSTLVQISGFRILFRLQNCARSLSLLSRRRDPRRSFFPPTQPSSSFKSPLLAPNYLERWEEHGDKCPTTRSTSSVRLGTEVCLSRYVWLYLLCRLPEEERNWVCVHYFTYRSRSSFLSHLSTQQGRREEDIN
jgi:hypothetical protein